MAVNIMNDFFYTVWGSEPVCALPSLETDDFLEGLCAQENALFADRAAMVLSVSSRNRTQFLQIEILLGSLKYFSEYALGSDMHIAEISAIQCRLLSFLEERGDLSLNKAIGQRIDLLRKSNILGYDTARKLISILTLIQEKKTEVDTTLESAEEPTVHHPRGESYKMTEIAEMLQHAIELPHLCRRLDAVPGKIKSQRFSIGITGVMNAGKSTMLNALLGQEILGTAVVPETANLTVIKYADKCSAEVHFWNTQEWKQIERSAETMMSMQHFVGETKEHFGTALSEYVTPEGRTEEIKTEALPSYTSAAHSEKRCNLVKSVTLYSDLAFVKGRVEIVDTPGLDDPVVQREEITKTYLAECDLLCHLMNVGQSATQKDVEFIIESLLYRNVAQLLVVITRIDMVEEEALLEVINYTKSSIKARLEALEMGARFEALIGRIVFIPIAGKMALLHRTDRAEEALALGYDLDRSGIPRIERYFSDVLFGEDAPKVRLLREASRKELMHLIHSQEKAYAEEKALLGQSAEEIAQAYECHTQEEVQSRQEVLRLEEEIALGGSELGGYLAILQKGAVEKFQSLQTLLGRRIMDDVRYSLRKTKQKPTPQRIKTMLITGLQDGLIDLLRDYRYGFQKRMDEVLERLGREFEDFAGNRTEETEVQESAKTLFSKYFDGLLLTGSHAVLVTQVNSTIAKHSKKEIEKMETQVQQALTEALEILQEKFLASVSVVNADLLEAFERRYGQVLEHVSHERVAQGEMLRKALEAVRESGDTTQQRIAEIEQKGALLVRYAGYLNEEEGK